MLTLQNGRASVEISILGEYSIETAQFREITVYFGFNGRVWEQKVCSHANFRSVAGMCVLSLFGDD